MGRLSEYDEVERKVIAPQAPAPEEAIVTIRCTRCEKEWRSDCHDGRVSVCGGESASDCPNLPEREPAPGPESKGLETLAVRNRYTHRVFRGATDSTLPEWEPLVLRSQAEAENARRDERISELEALWERAMMIEADLAVLRPIAKAAAIWFIADEAVDHAETPDQIQDEIKALHDAERELRARVDDLPADARERLMKGDL